MKMENNKKQTIAERFFRQRLLTPFVAVLLMLGTLVATGGACLWWPTFSEEMLSPVQSEEALYQEAVLDAMTVEADEILPLVTITPQSELVTWQDGKILLLTVNSHPERYATGSTFTLPGDIWAVTDLEFFAWYVENKQGVTDWTMRLKQLVGVPPDQDYTHVTAMWVAPEDVRRPAYLTDITSDRAMLSALPEDTTDEYKMWFNGNIIWSYFESSYPWTRLGYTYDWAADSDEYGLSEFWVRPYATVTIAYTYTIAEFIARLESGELIE